MSKGDGKVTVTFRILPEQAEKLRAIAHDQNTCADFLVIDALDAYLGQRTVGLQRGDETVVLCAIPNADYKRLQSLTYLRTTSITALVRKAIASFCEAHPLPRKYRKSA